MDKRYFLFSDVDLKKIDVYLQRQLEQNHVPGLACTLLHNGKVVKTFVHGYANLEWNIPVTVDTSFQLASGTKIFTGILVMKLVEQGVLSLDAPITTYLKNAPDEWAKISVRNLATHTSGLLSGVPVPGNPGIASDPTVTGTEQVVKIAAKHPLVYNPNTRSEYGLIDFTILTNIIEGITGKAYQTLLKEMILDPLEMSATRFTNATKTDGPIMSDIVARRAEMYTWQGGTQKTFSFPYQKWSYSSGGIYSSARDLAKLFLALESGALLSVRSLDEMWESHRLADGNYGDFVIGWVSRNYRNRQLVGHSGGPALSDLMYYRNRKIAIIVLANQTFMAPHLAGGVLDIMEPAPAPKHVLITDSQPQLTKDLHHAIDELTDSMFTPKMQSRLPILRAQQPLYTNQCGPLRSFDLFEDRQNQGQRMRRYVAVYDGPPGKQAVISFILTKDNKISDFGFVFE